MKAWRYVAGALTVGVVGLLCFAGIGQKAQGEGKLAAAKEPKAYTPRPKGTLTFTKDVAPILFGNCTTCHRPGEVAPFTLTNYADAKKRAKQLAQVVHSGYMPPWKAEAGFNEFVGERVLTPDQKGILQQWADEGAKEGNPKSLPALPKFTNGWTLGEPDAVYEPSAAYSLPSEGRDDYRNFVIPTDGKEDRYVTAMEVRAGNRAVVHHVIAYLDTTGAARKLDARDEAPGYTTFGGPGFTPSGTLGGWAPGNLPYPLPKGTGMLLPKGADIVLQVHYHMSGKKEQDKTKIGLYFSKVPVDKQLRLLPVIYTALNIPPGEANYQVKSAMPVFDNATLVNVLPHMHLLGREITLTANLPDGTTKPLVRIPDWDFNWQTTYTFKEAMKLPKGSSISLTARYDNSSQNPRNPSSPPKRVGWGEQTTDEMCVAFVGYTMDEESLTKGKKGEAFLDFGSGGTGGRRGMMRQMLKRFDKNGNGKLDPDELKEAMKTFQGVMGTSTTGKQP